SIVYIQPELVGISSPPNHASAETQEPVSHDNPSNINDRVPPFSGLIPCSNCGNEGHYINECSEPKNESIRATWNNEFKGFDG
ncbi:hypothetical protein PMAYCL1PPCAC_25469, partial [Pristionchus mayeri]